MREHVDALPRAESRPPADDWNGELRIAERGADVRGHIVRPFHGVPVELVVLRRQPAEVIVEVGNDVGVGVFLDRQGRGGVMNTVNRPVASPVSRTQATMRSLIS
jgi:hypothetical protein